MLRYLSLLSLLCFQVFTIYDDYEISYLSDFYNSLDGENWSETWDLVNTTDNTEYSLEKIYQNLVGEVALEFDTDRLVSITLENNGLAGNIPGEIKNLSMLQSLSLSNNAILYLPDLANNTNLTSLDLSLNSLTNYTDGTFPTTLTSVKLNNNSISSNISEILSSFADISTLVTLKLSHNQIVGSLAAETVLANETASLSTLGLKNNALTGNLPDIKADGWVALDLSYNSFTGDYPSNLLENDGVTLQCNMFNCASLTNYNATKYGIQECFCPSKGYEASIHNVTNDVSCTQCSDGKMANKWVRLDMTDYTYTCSTPSVGCVDCMFPENCKAGACQTGSTGPTCEMCEADYRMVGGTCRQCLDSKVPIAALVMLVFIAVIIGYGIFLTGLNMLAATMIKQIVTYFQIYYLTMDIRTTWPDLWAELGDVYKLSYMNSQAFDLDCLIPSLSTLQLFYIHWTSAVVWPVILTIIVVSVDKGYSRRLKQYEKGKDEEEKTAGTTHVRSKQAGMRRIYIMFMLIAFVPVTALSLRTFACAESSPSVVTVQYNDGNAVISNQWFYDNTVTCYDYTFQGVNFFATLLCVAEFGIIVFLFLILFRLWRFDLKDKQSEVFGALFESFNSKGLFCEPILLLRKFVLILSTQVTYFNPLYTGGINTLFSFSWLMLVITRQPYIPVTEGGRMFALLNNWCNLFEITATVLITLTQAYALADGIMQYLGTATDDFNTDALAYTMVVLHILLVLIWIIGFIVVLVKFTKAGIMDRKSRRSLRSQRSTRTLQAGAMMMNPRAKVTPVLGEEGGVKESNSSDVMIPADNADDELAFE